MQVAPEPLILLSVNERADRDENPAAGAVVVGVDGSDSSRDALAWAARQAKLIGAPLRVIAAWQFPTDFGWATPLPGDPDFEEEARLEADKAIAETITGELAEGLDVSVTVVEGHPAEVLTRESEQAALVVVGSRGHGAFTGMLLGSVGHHLAAHARCPLVIVRDKARPPR